MEITRFEQYIKGCLVTWNLINDTNGQIVNAVLGIGGEILELMASIDDDDAENIISEAGDVCYYTNILLLKMYQCVFQNRGEEESLEAAIDNVAFDFWELHTRSTQVYDKEMQKHLGFILETTKKFIFHGKGLDPMNMVESTLHIFMWLNNAIELSGLTLEEVMDYNFNKLSKRYPEGFKRLAEAQTA